MSAIYIVQYAGAPLRFTRQFAQVCTVTEASQFTSEAEAWLKCQAANLCLKHCAVVSLDEALRREGLSPNAKG